MFRVSQFLAMVSLVSLVYCQYTSQTYPDPRLDPLSCRLALPSTVCDPSAVLSDEERGNLVRKVDQLKVVTSNIRNTSPSCALLPDKNLEIIIAVIDKIGNIAGAPVDIEKFANNLKRRFQNFQDVGMCDTTVLIVNSRQDRQVFTVAGRDAKISKDVLKEAFERNIANFKSGNYAEGLEGMISIIVASYTKSHLVKKNTGGFGTAFIPTSSESGSFRAAGLRNSVQPAKNNFEPISQAEIDEKDQVWVSIMQQALSRCGQEPNSLPIHVRAVVEEAMSISLKLISDGRYNSIEEEVESNKDVIGIRDRAWEKAESEFIRPLFKKYRNILLNHEQSQCPSVTQTARKH